MANHQVASVAPAAAANAGVVQLDAKNRLKMFRRTLGLSRAQLGALVAHSEFTIGKVETGERGPGPELIGAIWRLTGQYSSDERVQRAGLTPITLWDWI